MKKLLNLIIAVFMVVLSLMPLYACNKSKPTKAFQSYSRYIEIHGVSKTLYYHNLKDNYFGDFSINVSALGNSIAFFFFPNDNIKSLSVFIHDSDPAVIDVLYTLSKLTVNMTYTHLFSQKSCKVDSVAVGGVEESTSSYFYSDSVEKAQKAVEKAVPWMTKIVKNCYGDYTVHDLYNH